MKEELIGKPAGFWRRFAATFIDTIILGLFFGVLALSIQGNIAIIANIIAVAAGICYFVLFLSSSWQATPGKRLFNVYVIGLGSEKPISIKRAFARYAVLNLIYLLTLPTIFFSTPNEKMPEDYSHRLSIIQSKIDNKEKLNAEDTKFINEMPKRAMHPEFSEEDFQKFKEIENKKAANQYLTPEEIEFSNKNNLAVAKSFLLGMLEFLYMTAIVITVAFTREKKGIHDMICKTRVIYGRPEKAAVA